MLARLIVLLGLLLLAPSAWAMPAVAVAAVAAAGSAYVAGTAFTLAVFAKSFAVSLAVSAISGALAKPRADTGSSGGFLAEAQDRTQVIRSAIEPRRLVYGRVAVAGPLVFACTSGDAYSRTKIFLHLVIPVAGHEIEAIDEVWFDDEQVGATNDNGDVITGRFATYARVRKYLGSASQTADPDLIAASGGRWTTAHRGRGVAYLYVRLTYSEGFWASGIPKIRAVVRGKKCYDTRDAVTRYTENWALIVRDYLTGDLGLGCDSTEIDDTLVTAAANVCDERVSLLYQPAFTTPAGSPTDDVLTFAATQSQIGTGDAVRYANSGGSAPGGLTSGNVYWYIRVGDTQGKLATSRANALAGTPVDLTSAGSGTHTLERVSVVASIDTGTDVFTLQLADSRLQTGDGVRIVATGSVPGGFSAGVTYYLIRTGELAVQLASSYANAIAGTAMDITGVGSGTIGFTSYDQARYTANGTVNLADKPLDIVQQLVTAAAGTVVYQQGEYRVYAGAYRTPSVQSDEDWLAGGLRVSPRIGRRELYNGVRGTFVDPSKSWAPTDFPPVTNSTYETQDGGEQILRDIQLPFTTHATRAQRIAKIHLEKSRQSIRVEMPCNMKAFKTAVWDTELLSIDLLGWSDKVFQILNWRYDPASGRVERVLQEEASSCYDWSAGDATLVDPAPNTQLPTPDLIRGTVPRNVSGLQIVGADPLATEFTGRDCKLQWRRASLFASYEVGSELYGADDGSQDFLFKDYQVSVYAAMTDATPLRTEYVVDPQYTYTFEKNSEDNAGVPLRAFVVKVWARTRYNRISAGPAVLKVSNPASVIAGVQVTSTVDGFLLTYTRPTDTDWTGIKVWASLTDAFTPSDSNLVYNGVDTSVVVRGLRSDTTYYYRYAPRDSFGLGTTSDQASLTTALNSQRLAVFYSGPIDAVQGGALVSPGGGMVPLVYTEMAFPTALPANLRCHLLGQAKSTNNDTESRAGIRTFWYDAKPTVTGTISSIVWDGAKWVITGSGTNFTAISWNNIFDLILLANGEGCFKPYSSTPVSDTVMYADYYFDDSVQGYASTYTYSGAWTVYKGLASYEARHQTLGYVNTQTGSYQTFAYVGGDTILPPLTAPTDYNSTMIGVLVMGVGVADAAGSPTPSVLYRNVQLDAQWVSGA